MRALLLLLAFPLFGQFTPPPPSGGGISGSGTANSLTKFTGSTAVGNSDITSDGTTITLGSPLVAEILHAGSSYLSATADVDGGGPNRCPTWYWGDNTCVELSALILNQDLSGDLSVSDATENTLDVYGDYSHTGTGTTFIEGLNLQTQIKGTGPVFFSGVNSSVQLEGSNHFDTLYGFTFYPTSSAFAGTISDLYYFYAYAPHNVHPTNEYVLWSGDLAATATNSFYSWFDSRGVCDVKEDNALDSVGQASMRCYNPLFAKYIPGAVDYERYVLRWHTNVTEIGAESGGTGVLREVRVIGQDLQIPVLAFAGLATPSNSAEAYCSDCTVTSGIDNTCAASGTGAWAERINGAWKCTQ